VGSVLLLCGLCGVLAGCSWTGSGAASGKGNEVRTEGVIVTVGGLAPGGPRPIANAQIRFVGTTETATARAGRNGQFAFEASPGSYKVQLVGHAPKVNGKFFKTTPATITVMQGRKPVRLVVEIK
jgi:hypothetical protein